MRHLPRTAAEIERLLMRWPLSIHLKIQLQKAKEREARQMRRVRSKLMGRIKVCLKASSVQELRDLARQLEAVREDAS